MQALDSSSCVGVPSDWFASTFIMFYASRLDGCYGRIWLESGFLR